MSKTNVEGAVRVEIKRRTEPAFVRPKFVYEISAPSVLGGTIESGRYLLIPLQGAVRVARGGGGYWPDAEGEWYVVPAIDRGE